MVGRKDASWSESATKGHAGEQDTKWATAELGPGGTLVSAGRHCAHVTIMAVN
jgi:hypothetical protein